MFQNLLERLEYKDEKNILIQGLPSSIEKQFAKLAFAKNVTPLLKARKIDFALVFAVNENQLKAILREVLPAMNEDGKFWIAYPKIGSKIATDLSRKCSWDCIHGQGFESVGEVALDHVWTALRFRRCAAELVEAEAQELEEAVYLTSDGRNFQARVYNAPEDFMRELERSKVASHFFQNLPNTNQKEYVSWIAGAKREDTRSKRLELAIDRLIAGKRNPTEK
jgi:hypothetical protein